MLKDKMLDNVGVNTKIKNITIYDHNGNAILF